MIIHFLKEEGLPVVVWPPAHAVTIQKEDLGEWNSLWVTVLCGVKKTKVILLLYSLKSSFHPVFHVGLTIHRSRQKNLYILQTESQSMNSFLKKWKATCCHLPILLLKLKWCTHLCNGCGMLFREITLALISPWYTVNWLTMSSLATEIFYFQFM